MASTEDLVPVRRWRRCPAWCQCSCGTDYWWTRWTIKRLGKPLSTKAAVGTVFAVTVCVFVATLLSLMTTCEDKSPALRIIFTVFVYLGIVGIAAVTYAMQRDSFTADDVEEVPKWEVLQSLSFASIVLLAVGCAALDIAFFLLVGSCVHRDRGKFPGTQDFSIGLAFHLGRLCFVVAQVTMFWWCFQRRNLTRQKVYTALLFSLVVMANLASWLYEIVDKPSVLCNNDDTCWDSTAEKKDTCNNLPTEFTEEYCTFVGFQLYCQPLVGTFALLSCATMYYLWSKAREGEGENAAERDSGQAVRNRPGAGVSMQFISVTVAALSVSLWVISQQATTVSEQADYYKVILYYSFKLLYFALFIVSTLAGCCRVRADGPSEYRSRAADIFLLILSAAGLLGLNIRALHGGATAQSKLNATHIPDSQFISITESYRLPDCPYTISTDDFGKVQALLITDVVLNIMQLFLQTWFIFSSITRKRLEENDASYNGLLCIFNLSVWINGSFVEVQSTPRVTCFTTPVQRAAFGLADWNVFLHLMYPLCMFYWLWSFLLVTRLLLRSSRLPGFSSGAATIVQDGQADGITIPMNAFN